MRTGLSVTPITSQALRQALRTLRQPGVVMTAVDRPDPQGEMLTFFGKPARLPVGLARLAIRTRVPILVEGTWETSPGRYRADLLTVLEPPAVSDETQATMDFAQQVLSHLEAFIRQRPEQWLMFFPVWKDV